MERGTNRHLLLSKAKGGGVDFSLPRTVSLPNPMLTILVPISVPIAAPMSILSPITILVKELLTAIPVSNLFPIPISLDFFQERSGFRIRLCFRLRFRWQSQCGFRLGGVSYESVSNCDSALGEESKTGR